MRDIYDEWTHYNHVVSSLSKDSLRLVLDLVTSPPENNPYTTLKARLLDSHQLTDYQRIEQLLAMDSLGSRKPSELLAHMLELCPTGEETSKFFGPGLPAPFPPQKPGDKNPRQKYSPVVPLPEIQKAAETYSSMIFFTELPSIRFPSEFK